MARGQRVYQRGKEYDIIGTGKRHRRVVFMGGLRVDGGQELSIFRPVRTARSAVRPRPKSSTSVPTT